MRSPSVFEPRGVARAWLVALLLASSLGAKSGVARADDKQACSAAYDETQALRRTGKLSAARQQALMCTRDACAEFIRTDCTRWLAEIESSQPTVVFEVRDEAGKETSAVRVNLDGKPWLETIDGRSKPIDPGQHTLHYVLARGGSVDDTVLIREGEKNRMLSASFPKAVAPPVFAAPPPPHRSEAPQRSVAPWVLGGLSLVTLAVGGALAGVVAADRSTTENPKDCNQSTLKCTPAGLSAADQGRMLGSVSTGFIVGAVGVGVGACAVWLIAREPARRPVLAAGPVLTASGAGWRLQGTW